MNPNNNNLRLQVLNSSSPSLRVAAAPTPQPTIMVGGNNPNDTVSIAQPQSSPQPSIQIPGSGSVSQDNSGYSGAQDNSVAQPQSTSLWGHLLNAGRDIAAPFVHTGEDVSNAIGNAEVGLAHTFGLAPNVKTETNAQQFGDINQGVGISNQDNSLKNFAGNVLQIAPVVAAPFTGGGSLALEAGADAGLGAVAGVGNAMTQDKQSLGSYVKNAALGGVLGAGGRFLAAGAGKVLSPLFGGGTADAISNAVANEGDAGTIQSALNTTPEMAHFLASETDPQVIKNVLDEAGLDTSKSALNSLQDAKSAKQATDQTSPIPFENPAAPLQSQLPAGWHPDGAPDPVVTLEGAARSASTPADFNTYINGLTGEDKAAAVSALDGMTPEEFYAKAGGGTSVSQPAADATASATPSTGVGQLPPEDQAAIKAAGGQIPQTTMHIPSKGIYAKLSPEQAAMLADETNNVKSGAGDIVHLSALTPQLEKNAKEVALEDLTKQSPNAAATIAKMENTLPPEDLAAIKAAGGQLPTANEEEAAAATGKNTGIRAGTSRINDALGTDLPESTYDKSPQAVLRSNSEQAANANLDEFTGKVMQSLNKTAGTLSDQEVSDAYTAAEKQIENGNIELGNEILTKTLPHDTATAQALAARGLLTRNSPLGMQKMILSTLEKANVPFEGDLAKNVTNLLDVIKNAPEGSPEREFAVRQLADEVVQSIPRTKWRATAEMWRAGLISGPQTAAKVMISQPFSAAQAYLSQFPAAGFDATRAAITGGERTTAVAPFKYFFKGLGSGAEDAATKLKTGIDVPGSGGFTNPFDQALQTGAHQTAGERAIFKLHSAIQKPVYAGIRDNTLASLGKAEAINQGLTGAERSSFIEDYVKNPPQDAYAHAVEAGEKATNQQRTALGNAANAVQSAGGKPGSPGPGMIIAPITRVPGAIGTNALYEYSGLKFAKTALYDGLVKQGAAPDFARTLAEDFGKATVGAGGVSGVGAILGATGNITPPKFTSQKEAALAKAQGKPAGSVHLPGTNFWFSLNALGPVGIELASGAGFGRGYAGHSVAKGTSGIAGALTEGIASGAQELAQQPYLQGITGVGNVLQDPVRYARSFASNLATSVIPAAISQPATGTDSKARDINYNSITDVAKSKIPGLRETIPASTDVLGDTTPGANPSGSLLGGVFGTLDALKITAQRNQNDPITNELSRLATTLPDADAPAIAAPTRSQTIDINQNGKVVSQKMNLNDQQLSDYTQNTGNLIRQGIANLLQNPAYQQLSDAEKAKQVNAVITAAHDAGKVSLLNSQPKSLTGDAKTALFNPDELGQVLGGANLNLTTPYAKNFYNKWNSMSTTDQQKWLASAPDQNATAIATMVNAQKAPALQPFQPSNSLSKLYANYENDINSHSTGPNAYTPLDLRQKAESFQKAAAMLNLSKMAQDIYQSGGSQDVKTLASEGKISKADLDAAINLDNQLYESGLTSSPKFAKTFRTAFGYAEPTLYGSNGTQPYSSSSSSSGSSGSSTGKFNQRLTTLLKPPTNLAMPAITGVNSPAGTKLPRFSTAARPTPVSIVKFKAPNVTPSKGSTKVVGTGEFNTTRASTLRTSLGP